MFIYIFIAEQPSWWQVLLTASLLLHGLAPGHISTPHQVLVKGFRVQSSGVEG